MATQTDVDTLRLLASSQPATGLLTADQIIAAIREGLKQGMPPLGPGTTYPQGIRRPPRSLNTAGLYPTATEKIYSVEGPFGPVTALYVDNTDATYAVTIRFTDLQAQQAVLVRAAKNRRIEFDTPTDNSGYRLNTFSIGIAGTGTLTAPVYVEVE